MGLSHSICNVGEYARLLGDGCWGGAPTYPQLPVVDLLSSYIKLCYSYSELAVPRIEPMTLRCIGEIGESSTDWAIWTQLNYITTSCVLTFTLLHKLLSHLHSVGLLQRPIGIIDQKRAHQRYIVCHSYVVRGRNMDPHSTTGKSPGRSLHKNATNGTRCHVDGPHQKCGPLWGLTTCDGQDQREKNEVGRTLCQTPRTRGEQTDFMGANPRESQEGKEAHHLCRCAAARLLCW